MSLCEIELHRCMKIWSCHVCRDQIFFHKSTHFFYQISTRVSPLVSDLWAHLTTYSTNHLKWFFTKKIFWEMFPRTKIKIQSFRKQSSKKGHSMNGFQKFLCVVNRHEESDFLVFWIFWLRSFFGHFSRCHGSKK